MNTKVRIFPPENQKKSPAKKPGKQYNSYALIVESKGKDYKETLKNVKEILKTSEDRGIVKNFRSTIEGDHLISTDKDREALEQLKSTFDAANTGRNIRIAGEKKDRKCTLHIRGIDATTTGIELKDSLMDHLGDIGDRDIKIGELIRRRSQLHLVKAMPRPWKQKAAFPLEWSDAISREGLSCKDAGNAGSTGTIPQNVKAQIGKNYA